MKFINMDKNHAIDWGKFYSDRQYRVRVQAETIAEKPFVVDELGNLVCTRDCYTDEWEVKAIKAAADIGIRVVYGIELVDMWRLARDIQENAKNAKNKNRNLNMEKFKMDMDRVRNFVRQESFLNQTSLVWRALETELLDRDDVNTWGEVDEEGEGEETREIYQWLTVSDWLAQRLEEEGETVLRSDYGTWWGRSCFGQALEDDAVLQRIVKNI